MVLKRQAGKGYSEARIGHMEARSSEWTQEAVGRQSRYYFVQFLPGKYSRRPFLLVWFWHWNNLSLYISSVLSRNGHLEGNSWKIQARIHF